MGKNSKMFGIVPVPLVPVITLWFCLGFEYFHNYSRSSFIQVLWNRQFGSVMIPEPLRQNLNNYDCLEDKTKDYHNCSVLYCVQQLCMTIYTHTTWANDCWFRLGMPEYRKTTAMQWVNALTLLTPVTITPTPTHYHILIYGVLAVFAVAIQVLLHSESRLLVLFDSLN